MHRTQGYYRRGDAHFALGKYKDALRDFKSAARLAPRDPDLRKKLAACDKEVKRIRFEEALATPVSAVNMKHHSIMARSHHIVPHIAVRRQHSVCAALSSVPGPCSLIGTFFHELVVTGSPYCHAGCSSDTTSRDY